MQIRTDAAKKTSLDGFAMLPPPRALGISSAVSCGSPCYWFRRSYPPRDRKVSTRRLSAQAGHSPSTPLVDLLDPEPPGDLSRARAAWSRAGQTLACGTSRNHAPSVHAACCLRQNATAEWRGLSTRGTADNAEHRAHRSSMRKLVATDSEGVRGPVRTGGRCRRDEGLRLMD